jgi:hypothetical protein
LGSYFKRPRAVPRLQICRGSFDVPYTMAYRTDSASIHLAKSWQQSRWLSHLDLTLGNSSLRGNPPERPRPPSSDRGLTSGSIVPSLTHTTRRAYDPNKGVRELHQTDIRRLRPPLFAPDPSPPGCQKGHGIYLEFGEVQLAIVHEQQDIPEATFGCTRHQRLRELCDLSRKIVVCSTRVATSS